MNVDNELTDFDAAGSLAEELPWWGWLEDGRSCLTRAGELMSIGRMTPSVLDGQTPEQLDWVMDRWQRMLSGLDSRTRLYFYLLRCPIRFENQGDGEASSVAALGRRKRQAFLEKRLQSVSAYVALAHDPGLSAVTTQKTGGPWWMARRRNRPGSFWDGATGSGMNWRLVVSELEAARRKTRGAQRHYFSKRYSMAAHVQETEGSAAAAESDRLGDALVELETDGIAYGDLSLTIAIHGDLEQIERLDGDIRRIFAAQDAKLIREGYGQLPAWFSRMPAQPRRRQVRSVFVSAGAAACMAPIFGPPVGTPHSGHLRAPALAILETQWRTPYHTTICFRATWDIRWCLARPARVNPSRSTSFWFKRSNTIRVFSFSI